MLYTIHYYIEEIVTKFVMSSEIFFSSQNYSTPPNISAT